MRHPIVRAVGFVLIGLAVIVLALEVALAIRSGHAFYGENYWLQPLGVAYPIIIGLFAIAAGAYVGVRRLLLMIGRRKQR